MSIEQWMESEAERREAEQLTLDAMRTACEQWDRFVRSRALVCYCSMAELEQAAPGKALHEWANRFISLANLIDTPHPAADRRTWPEVREEFLNGDGYHPAVVHLIDSAIAGKTAAIAKCLAKLVGRSEFRRALCQLNVQLSAWKPSQPQVSESKRTCYDRDHAWLKWHEAEGESTFHSPAAIRDKWNEAERDIVSIESVTSGIKKAKRERKEESAQSAK